MKMRSPTGTQATYGVLILILQVWGQDSEQVITVQLSAHPFNKPIPIHNRL